MFYLLAYFSTALPNVMQISLRDAEVERLNTQVRQLQLQVNDLQHQLDVSAEKVQLSSQHRCKNVGENIYQKTFIMCK